MVANDLFKNSNNKVLAEILLGAFCLFTWKELEAKLDELKKKKIEKPAESKKAQQKSANNAEDELSEEEKAKLKSKPISSTAVPGTPWCVVWTRDKRVFFYNPSEKISLWERPQILTGRPDVDKLIKEPPAAINESATATNSSSNQSNRFVQFIHFLKTTRKHSFLS